MAIGIPAETEILCPIGSSVLFIIAGFLPSLTIEKFPVRSKIKTKCLRLISGSPDNGNINGF